MPFELRPEPQPTMRPEGDYLRRAWSQSVFPIAERMGVVTRLACEVGLDEVGFEEALRTRRYREAHRQGLRHAYEEVGVNGVPMFVLGEQVLSGLQDRETLESVIEEDLPRQDRPDPAGCRDGNPVSGRVRCAPAVA
jgi:hypothetical protein